MPSVLDDRTVFLVPPCDSDADGELTVQGARQSRALGDAFGDVPLMAVYTGPGQAERDTGEAVAQRHGLVVRRKPGLVVHRGELFNRAVHRITEVFETMARAGPGRTILVVAEVAVARIVLSHCWDLSPSPDDQLQLGPGSITEITVAPSRYVVARLNDTSHLRPSTPA
jgi:broad specificity phosphatase PhoE